MRQRPWRTCGYRPAAGLRSCEATGKDSAASGSTSSGGSASHGQTPALKTTGSARWVFRPVCLVGCCPCGRRRVPRAARRGGVPGRRGAFAYQVTTSVSGSRRLRGPPVCEEGGRGRLVCEEGLRGRPVCEEAGAGGCCGPRGTGRRGAFAYQGTTSVSGSHRLRGRPVCEEGGRGRLVCEEGARRPGGRRGPGGAAGGGVLFVPGVPPDPFKWW